MEEKELMTTENNETIEEEVEVSSGLGTGLAILIGSGLTLAAVAGGRKLKKMWKTRKTEEESTEHHENDGDEVENSDSSESK